MITYVNADKIISHLNDEIEACGDPDVYSQPVGYGTRLGLEYSKSLVETAETADVVKVVRCKDCKYFSEEIQHCNILGFCEPNEYCSRGERREENENSKRYNI